MSRARAAKSEVEGCQVLLEQSCYIVKADDTDKYPAVDVSKKSKHTHTHTHDKLKVTPEETERRKREGDLNMPVSGD